MNAKKPTIKPDNPRFSCGPCRKHSGWDPKTFQLDVLGRNHRSKTAQARIHQAIQRSSKLMQLPGDWGMAVIPGSNTGAFELALWNLLGERGVDAFVWESFSNDWAYDIERELQLDDVNIYRAEYGDISDLSLANPNRDCVFVYNGTTSGVRVPNLDWIQSERTGLTICDATSAVFANELDYSKLDVVTWSWQKALGGEAGYGMLALSPNAIQRFETFKPDRPIPKNFRITEDGVFNKETFIGSTLNTQSLLAVEDLHSSLDWAESIGGLENLIQRCDKNFQVINEWVRDTDWIDWLPNDHGTYSNTSLCLKIVSNAFKALDETAQKTFINSMVTVLEQEDVAYDISAYRKAPVGLRVWSGPTVEKMDLEKLLPWLEWAYAYSLKKL